MGKIDIEHGTIDLHIKTTHSDFGLSDSKLKMTHLDIETSRSELAMTRSVLETWCALGEISYSNPMIGRLDSGIE
jgi:hypothetical protein